MEFIFDTNITEIELDKNLCATFFFISISHTTSASMSRIAFLDFNPKKKKESSKSERQNLIQPEQPSYMRETPGMCHVRFFQPVKSKWQLSPQAQTSLSPMPIPDIGPFVRRAWKFAKSLRVRRRWWSRSYTRARSLCQIPMPKSSVLIYAKESRLRKGRTKEYWSLSWRDWQEK